MTEGRRSGSEGATGAAAAVEALRQGVREERWDDRTKDAAARLLAVRRYDELTEVAGESSPDGRVGELLRRALTAPRTLRRLIVEPGVSGETVERVLAWAGASAADVVAEVLADADPPAPGVLYRALAGMGPAAGRALEERWDALPDGVREGLLATFLEERRWPAGFSFLSLVEDDPAPAVRSAAFKLAVAKGQRQEAVACALEADSDPLLRLALSLPEAGESRFEPRLRQLAASEDLSPPTRVLAVRRLERLVERSEAPLRLRRLLARDPPDFEEVDEILDGGGPAGRLADVLLDALAEEESRSARRDILNRLVELGSPVARLIPERLDDPRWFVRRNLLNLLHELPSVPEGFSALPFLRDRSEDARVRVEAFKTALRVPDERDRAVRTALGDSDERVFRLALGALSDRKARALAPLLMERARDQGLSASARAAAVRSLTPVESEEVRDFLLDLAGDRRPLVGYRISEKSPPVLAALSVLAMRWSGDDAVRKLLERARGSDDPDVRGAVARPSGSTVGER